MGESQQVDYPDTTHQLALFLRILFMNKHEIIFNNKPITVVVLGNTKYVAMKHVSDALWLDWSAQYRRINGDSVLSEAISIIKIPSIGGSQDTLVLPIEYLDIFTKGIRHYAGKINKGSIYAILFNNNNVKIGKSLNLKSRLKQHKANAECFGIEYVTHTEIVVDDIDKSESIILKDCVNLCERVVKNEWLINANYDKIKNVLLNHNSTVT